MNNLHLYLAKADFVNQAAYGPGLRPHRLYSPVFKLLELPGAPFNLVGILNPDADPEEVWEMRATPSQFARAFFHQVLNPAIELFPASSRSRFTNLAAKTAQTSPLPTYYGQYAEDVPQLSANIS